MSELTTDIATRASTSAAKTFIDGYYSALNDVNLRSTLATFYIQASPTSPAGADISLNGNVVPSAVDLQTLFEQQMPKAHYEVQSYDCHVVNPNYNVGLPDNMLGPDLTGKKISVMVLVSGYVRYGDFKDAKMRGFTENIVLVPNYEPLGKRHLIQSQNFRMLL